MAKKKYSTSGELMKDVRNLDYKQQYKVLRETDVYTPMKFFEIAGALAPVIQA